MKERIPDHYDKMIIRNFMKSHDRIELEGGSEVGEEFAWWRRGGMDAYGRRERWRDDVIN